MFTFGYTIDFLGATSRRQSLPARLAIGQGFRFARIRTGSSPPAGPGSSGLQNRSLPDSSRPCRLSWAGERSGSAGYWRNTRLQNRIWHSPAPVPFGWCAAAPEMTDDPESQPQCPAERNLKPAPAGSTDHATVSRFSLRLFPAALLRVERLQTSHSPAVRWSHSKSCSAFQDSSRQWHPFRSRTTQSGLEEHVL